MATESEEAIECLEAAGYCDDPKDMLEEVRFASAWTSDDPKVYTPSPIADMRVIANAVTDAEQCCDLGEEVNLSGIIAALKEVIKASEQAG